MAHETTTPKVELKITPIKIKPNTSSGIWLSNMTKFSAPGDLAGIFGFITREELRNTSDHDLTLKGFDRSDIPALRLFLDEAEREWDATYRSGSGAVASASTFGIPQGQRDKFASGVEGVKDFVARPAQQGIAGAREDLQQAGQFAAAPFQRTVAPQLAQAGQALGGLAQKGAGAFQAAANKFGGSGGKRFSFNPFDAFRRQ